MCGLGIVCDSGELFFQENDCSRLNYLCSVVGKIKKKGSQQCMTYEMEPYIGNHYVA